MRHTVDDCRAVMTSVLERLSKDAYSGLSCIGHGRRPLHTGEDFGDLIRIVRSTSHPTTCRRGGAERADDGVPQQADAEHVRGACCRGRGRADRLPASMTQTRA